MKSLKTIALLLTVLTFLYDSANGQCKYSVERVRHGVSGTAGKSGAYYCVCTTDTSQSEVDRCDKEIRGNYSWAKVKDPVIDDNAYKNLN
jgi:hypothetical protein